jgi:hypothetical protein
MPLWIGMSEADVARIVEAASIAVRRGRADTGRAGTVRRG